MPAVIKAIGAPLNGRGTSAPSIFSLRAENNTKTNENPIAAPKPYNPEAKRLEFSVTFKSATPKTAQLVVINGRKIPRDCLRTGEVY